MKIKKLSFIGRTRKFLAEWNFYLWIMCLNRGWH